MGLLDMLGQALNQGAQVDPKHIEGMAQQAPADVLGQVLGDTFRSPDTPDIGSLVAGMFGQSNGTQQAGMLNQIIATLGPAVAGALAGGALTKVLGGGQQVTPEQASQLSPEVVTQVVNEAQAREPGLADQLGQFYAQHSGLINALGGLAAMYAMNQMKNRLTNR